MNKLATMIGAAVAVACAAKAATLDERVEELLSRMTLEEKIGQLWQTDGGKVQGGAASEDLSNAGISEEFLDEVRAGRYGSLIGMRGAKGYNVLQKAATEGRLGVPLLIGHDMIHSARTCFPVPLALSCSWDTNLVERIGEAMAVESLTMGCNWTFAPMLDVALDARWGRIVEGSGSDPFLTSRFGEAWVRGIQGKDMADGRHIAACAKHYVAYGACMGGRDYNAVEMSDDTLRDVYLPPFKAAIDAGVATVMPAFHSFNGVPCSMNRYLLTDILRGEFGFDGMTISDYNAVDEMATGHGVAVQGADAAAKALNAGMDMEMISRNYPTGLAEAVRSGAVDIAVIDEAVRRVLRVKFRLGLFDNPFIDIERLEKTIDLAAHRALAREAAAKSVVLLKNADNILPLGEGAKVALVGAVADNAREMQGAWCTRNFTNTTNDTLKAGLAADGANISYARAYGWTGKVDCGAIKAVAKDADVVVVAIGQTWSQSGENNSCASIELDPSQLKAVRYAKSLGKKVVAVVFGGRPLAIPELAKEADAIVMAWSPGGAGGWGVADVLLGIAEPYGRLTTDFPTKTGECPKFYHRTTTGRPHKPGERWTTRYVDAPDKSLYPFGYGLTYTTFSYANESVRVEGDKVVFSAEVTNTGARRGSELVQVYIQDVLAATVRPRRQLKGFERVMLEPGESRHVEIAVPVESLGYAVGGKYRVEPGQFRAWIAGDSDSGKTLEWSL